VEPGPGIRQQMEGPVYLEVTVVLDHDIVDRARAALRAQQLRELVARGLGLNE
jgi:hypothetical protein